MGSARTNGYRTLPYRTLQMPASPMLFSILSMYLLKLQNSSNDGRNTGHVVDDMLLRRAGHRLSSPPLTC